MKTYKKPELYLRDELEIKKLKELNSELLEALEEIGNTCKYPDTDDFTWLKITISEIAIKAINKAKGEDPHVG